MHKTLKKSDQPDNQHKSQAQKWETHLSKSVKYAYN